MLAGLNEPYRPNLGNHAVTRMPDLVPHPVSIVRTDPNGAYNGRAIGRLEPLDVAAPPGWEEIMGEVWREQKSVKAAHRVPNPVLRERQRRRR